MSWLAMGVIIACVFITVVVVSAMVGVWVVNTIETGRRAMEADREPRSE